MVTLLRIAAALWAVGGVCNILTDGPQWLSAAVLTGALACWVAAILLRANETVDEIIKNRSEDQ
jgi:hypothetical protein